MRHRVSGKKLGRDIKERKALFKNLVISLISHGKIKTTKAKAKAIKGLVDKLVSKAKQGTLHARRQVLAFLSQKEAVKKLFDEIGPRFERRASGFTRIINIGQRQGDNAPMVVMEWTEQKTSAKGRSSSGRKNKKQRAKNTSGVAG